MCAAILGVRAPCLATAGNLNNEYGLPLTLLRREPRHRSVVVELGMNHRGEIARLAAIAQPHGRRAHQRRHRAHRASRQPRGDRRGEGRPGGGAAGGRRRRAERRRRAGQRAGGAHARPRAALRPRPQRGRARRGAARARGRLRVPLRTPQGSVAVEVAGLAETSVTTRWPRRPPRSAPACRSRTWRPASRATRRCAGASRRWCSMATCCWSTTPTTRIRSRWRWRCARWRAARRERLPPHRGARRHGRARRRERAGAPRHRRAGRQPRRRPAGGGRRPRRPGGGSGARGGLGGARVHVESDAERAAERVLAELRPRDRVLVKGSRSMRMERVVDRIAQARGGRHAAASGDTH